MTVVLTLTFSRTNWIVLSQFLSRPSKKGTPLRQSIATDASTYDGLNIANQMYILSTSLPAYHQSTLAPKLPVCQQIAPHAMPPAYRSRWDHYIISELCEWGNWPSNTTAFWYIKYCNLANSKFSPEYTYWRSRSTLFSLRWFWSTSDFILASI